MTEHSSTMYATPYADTYATTYATSYATTYASVKFHSAWEKFNLSLKNTRKSFNLSPQKFSLVEFYSHFLSLEIGFRPLSS